MKELESTKVSERTSPDCGKPVVSGSVIRKPKNKLKNMIHLIFWLYIILLSDLKLEASTKKTTYEFKYNGLVCVALDYYSIVKYDSLDDMLKWIEFRRTEHLR